MNKKFSRLLNVVLIIAVAFLYYLHFSSNSKTEDATAKANDSAMAAKPIVRKPTVIKSSKIVYINSDILNQKYDYVKDLTSAAQAKQGKLEAAYQAKGQKLQEDYADFQQKASQGLLSENQSVSIQTDLKKRKDELDQMEAQLQQLVEEIQKSNEEVRKTVIDYVKEYNKTSKYNYILTYTEGPGGIVLLANDSLDITDEIIEGLNAQYQVKKKK